MIHHENFSPPHGTHIPDTEQFPGFLEKYIERSENNPGMIENGITAKVARINLQQLAHTPQDFSEP